MDQVEAVDRVRSPEDLGVDAGTAGASGVERLEPQHARSLAEDEPLAVEVERARHHVLGVHAEVEQAGGHRVEVAYSATDALELAKSFVPEVCLLDIGLPDFDGNELARRLRMLPQAAGATLIAMTGYGRQQDREASMAAGFDHYLVKPVNTTQLADILAAAAEANIRR